MSFENYVIVKMQLSVHLMWNVSSLLQEQIFHGCGRQLRHFYCLFLNSAAHVTQTRDKTRIGTL